MNLNQSNNYNITLNNAGYTKIKRLTEKTFIYNRGLMQTS